MSKFKLKKGMRIGDLAAENDKLLESVFVDQGYVDDLLDTADPKFLVVGRTGSGKTALLRQISRRAEYVHNLNPEELSMQYLHNSQVLRLLTAWGVNLEIFYKFLWRHVCVLELIRMRYPDTEAPNSLIDQIIRLVSPMKRDEQRSREAAQKYLKDYGSDFFLTTDTRIRKIVEEIESKLQSDDKIGLNLKIGGLGAEANSGHSEIAREHQRVESEVIDRAQRIVSDFLIADLRRVIELLGKAGFDDPQKRFYLVIDDLDKNWMPDDALYLELTKSLLHTVYDLNRTSPLKGVKIIIALRENIYHRAFQKSALHEPQREKWADVQVRIRWTAAELTDLVDRRLKAVFRNQYTHQAPTFSSILPNPRKKGPNDSAFQFILARTFMRPRDVIDYVNTAIGEVDSVDKLTWSHLTRAEVEYSERRLKSVFDEWKDSYFGLPCLWPLLRRIGPRFRLDAITNSDVESVLSSKVCESCAWLSRLQSAFCNDLLGQMT